MKLWSHRLVKTESSFLVSNIFSFYYIFSIFIKDWSWENFENVYALAKENRIYIWVKFTRKKCKSAILLYCFHCRCTSHICAIYNLLGPGTSFYRKSKINIKENYEIDWFYNWQMIISHRLNAFHFTNDDFPLKL